MGPLERQEAAEGMGEVRPELEGTSLKQGMETGNVCGGGRQGKAPQTRNRL